jgi:hypothetical protein
VDDILKDLHDHQHLRSLDLSDNNIQNMEELSNLLVNNNSIQELNLKGNVISSVEQFEYIMVGMTSNISLV